MEEGDAERMRLGSEVYNALSRSESVPICVGFGAFQLIMDSGLEGHANGSNVADVPQLRGTI
jgi:hypothetical protein